MKESEVLRDGVPYEPVNRQAVNLFRRGNQAPEYTIPPEIFHSETCPPLASKAMLATLAGDHDRWLNLTGRTFGRMTVTGLLRENHSRWVVRCACGNYELRSAKSIKNPANTNDACLSCRHTRTVKRHNDWFTRRQENDLIP